MPSNNILLGFSANSFRQNLLTKTDTKKVTFTLSDCKVNYYYYWRGPTYSFVLGSGGDIRYSVTEAGWTIYYKNRGSRTRLCVC
jgi:hypothetical protein